jgi:DNA-binding transcriptional LysR family regulator
MNDRDLATSLEKRRLDVAVMASHALWPHAASVPLYRDRLVAAFPLGHRLTERETVDWASLRDETILVQGG